MNRLFISLDIPHNIIDQLVELRNSICNSDDFRWEPSSKLHLTLNFIGDVSQKTTDLLADRLNLLSNFKTVDCSFNRFGFFFRDNKPSILWGGLIIDENINLIIEKIDEILSEFLIISDKKKFNPHITLLRLRKDPGSNFVNKFKNFSFEPILFQTDSVTLYKSVLDKTGSKYYEIKKYHLK